MSDLHHSFDIIGLSETKPKTNQSSTANISLPGYNFISQPSKSLAGGVCCYIKNNIKFNIRNYLNIISNEQETYMAWDW